MKDLVIQLENRPGAIAEMGEALEKAKISVEGGGAWVVNHGGVAHFLFKEPERAKEVLEKSGIKVIKINDILVQRLKQDVPGQLGKITRLMEQSGVNIEALYSDHDHQLILVVDNYEKGKIISENWKKGKYLYQ